jgi:two-component system LytT family sensor kinase
MNEADTSLQLLKSLVRRHGRWIVGMFWILQFAELSLVGFVEGGPDVWRLLAARAIVAVIGFLLTLGIIEVSAGLADRAFRTRLKLTALAALVTWVMLVLFNLLVFYYALPTSERTHAIQLGEFAYTSFAWSWFFLSVAAAVLALSYGFEARDTERRLATMEAIAKDARMAALRYQLNPHFLFNTLNSVAALIDDGDSKRAERMVENLSDFLRATLELDPVMDVSLEREMELQALYLSIESVRFPDRLTTRYDLPQSLGKALVPALITQPLVENAIRHAVARSKEEVVVTISARLNGDVLSISVEDDGRPVGPALAGGTGIGLTNVRARLANRFGTAGKLSASRDGNRGYRCTIEMPVQRS